MSDDLPREAVIPLPVREEPPPTPVPVQYTRPGKSQHYQQPDEVQTTREIMVRAAEAYDNTQRVIEDLRSKLDAAILNIEGKNNHIQQLEATVAEMRNRTNDYRTERDEAVTDRADVLACLEGLTERIASLMRTLEKFDFPSRKRKKKPAPAVEPTSADILSGSPSGPIPGNGDVLGQLQARLADIGNGGNGNGTVEQIQQETT